MTEPFLGELARVFAYGGVGMVVGFVAGQLASDEHRIAKSLLEGDVRMTTPEARRARERRMQILQTVTVVIVMIAMLLTGITWMQTERANSRQDRRDCQRLAAVSKALQERTAVYREAAVPERKLWVELREQIVMNGAKRNSPAVEAIDEYLNAQELYVQHLAANPYPTPTPGECD